MDVGFNSGFCDVLVDVLWDEMFDCLYYIVECGMQTLSWRIAVVEYHY